MHLLTAVLCTYLLWFWFPFTLIMFIMCTSSKTHPQSKDESTCDYLERCISPTVGNRGETELFPIPVLRVQCFKNVCAQSNPEQPSLLSLSTLFCLTEKCVCVWEQVCMRAERCAGWLLFWQACLKYQPFSGKRETLSPPFFVVKTHTNGLGPGKLVHFADLLAHWHCWGYGGSAQCVH